MDIDVTIGIIEFFIIVFLILSMRLYYDKYRKYKNLYLKIKKQKNLYI